MKEYLFKVIARIESDFPEKFGIPRQSGLLRTLKSTIRFEKEFRNPDALRGLEGFSHLWLLWIFSENVRDTWHPTVRPPRLGGNTRLGVFATRSSFRPNPLAMSCVKIEEIRPNGKDGPEIVVSGADLMDGTPIVDIKPYLPYADCKSDAVDGLAGLADRNTVDVDFPEALLQIIPEDKRESILEVLRQDPRPGYRHAGDERRYGVKFAGFDVRFIAQADGLRVVEVVPLEKE